VALPVVSGHRVIKVLKMVGFMVAGRKVGHINLKKKVNNKIFVVIVRLVVEERPPLFFWCAECSFVTGWNIVWGLDAADLCY